MPEKELKILAKSLSSLEKCFLDESVYGKTELTKASAFLNERYSFQICFQMENTRVQSCLQSVLTIESPLADHIRIFKVESVPSELPAYASQQDADYLRTEPGLFPDLLTPENRFHRVMVSGHLKSVWLEIDPNGAVPAGVYPIHWRIESHVVGSVAAEGTFELELIDAMLPPQKTRVTQWFHCDCLQTYYGTGSFDERHWQIIENFIAVFAKNGLNMILTPVLTPPLDTYVGGERPTTQLVDITVTDGVYSFGFTKLERWVKLCRKYGIRYFEISHLFTQWGAAHCPKVMATVDGEMKKIFGWESDATSQEYADFLKAFLPALLAFFKKKKLEKYLYFHISDEPNEQHLDNYSAAMALVKPLVEGAKILDALSNAEFFDRGLTEIPVPGNNHIEPFMERNPKERWTYYCCGQSREVSNRFLAMPSYRNRILGLQMARMGIVGFLQWGYNFYYNQYSYDLINPYVVSDGEDFVPSGDAYSVYPGSRGECLESLRIKVFYEGLQDIRAVELHSRICGKKETEKLFAALGTFNMKEYPRDPQALLRFRQRLNQAVKEKLAAR